MSDSVKVNTASAFELMKIPGIGKTLADLIISLRNYYGVLSKDVIALALRKKVPAHVMELLDFEEPDLFNASVKTGLVDEQLYSASENTDLLVESLGGMDLSHHSEEEQGSHSKSPIREMIPSQEIGIGAKPKTSKVYSLIDYESEVDESEALKWHPISCKGQQTSMAVGACSTPYAAVDKNHIRWIIIERINTHKQMNLV